MRIPREEPRSAVLRMLDDCFPTHTRVEKNHHIWVQLNGVTFNQLPIGDRSKSDPGIGTSQIRKMVRKLGLERNLDCCVRHFPWLECFREAAAATAAAAPPPTRPPTEL